MKCGRKLGVKVKPNKHYNKTTLEDLNALTYMPSYEDLWVDVDGNVIRVKIWEDEVYYAHVKPSWSNAGYLQVGANKKGWPVHILMAKAFIGPRPEGCDVNHKDRDHENNFILNLEYLETSKNRSPRYYYNQI